MVQRHPSKVEMGVRFSLPAHLALRLPTVTIIEAD